MSRRSDREGIAPESLSNWQSSRWMAARNMANAAAWRRNLAAGKSPRREDRETSLAWFRFELGLATAKRGFRDFAVLP